MSTDFNIKPVGAPVAAPIVQPISEAAHHAVATELPAPQSVTASDAGARASDSAALWSSLHACKATACKTSARIRLPVRWLASARLTIRSNR